MTTSTLTIPKSEVAKGLAALGYGLLRPSRAARVLKRAIISLYQERIIGRSPIPTVPLSDLVPPSTALQLSDFHGRTGNVTLHELLSITAIVRHRAPRVLFEIGTFDGNTALQMALNCAEDSRVYTLDLPPNASADEAAADLDPHDSTYIEDEQKLERRFTKSSVAHKVVQCFGDSATFDFNEVAQDGRPELVFIDGSHSYDYVRSDTEKARAVLAPGGAILWHDYTPAWPGVMEYLSALSGELPLRHIEGTTLVYCEL